MARGAGRLSSLLPRALRRRLTGAPAPRLGLVYSPRYRLGGSGVAHDPYRGEKVLGFLAAHRLVRRGGVEVPPIAPWRSLRRVHDVDYLESLADPATLTRIVGQPIDERTRARFLELQRRMAGGTRLAVSRALADGGIVLHLGGGLHHAFPDRGERFCLLNDVAVAVAEARREGLAGRVLVVDCDLHDGDGTRAVFARDPSVHTFSIHNQSSGTDPDAVESTSIELGAGIDDARLLAALAGELPPLVERLRPALVLYLAGADPAEDDELGDWRMSGAGLLERDRFVTELVRGRSGGRGRDATPLVVTLAGGYGRAAWRYSARYAAWLATGGELEPPTDEELTLGRYRRAAATFSVAELSGEPGAAGGAAAGEPDGADGGAEWDLWEDDVLGPLAGAPPRRLLGFYSRDGVELALERVGLLDRLRELGYPRPTVSLDLGGAAGDTVRLHGGEGGRDLLIELRAARDRHSLPGFELLRVEWLLLQNPRARFSTERRPLPGQRHPGLGLLAEIAALLVLICERLKLDGILFVPSHYHLAAQSRRYLRFVEPEDEARFRAMERAVGDLGLGEATRAVDGGRLLDAASGEPFEMPAMPMVLPVSDRLTERVTSESYRRRADRAEARYELLRGEGRADPG